MLFRGGNTTSHLISVEHTPLYNSYKPWTNRPKPAVFQGLRGTATIEIDIKGRMWMASNGINEINARWSDAPFSTWSEPITLARNTTLDDISGITVLPGKIGVFWSDQNTNRFGFKTHTDGS